MEELPWKVSGNFQASATLSSPCIVNPSNFLFSVLPSPQSQKREQSDIRNGKLAKFMDEIRKLHVKKLCLKAASYKLKSCAV